MFFSSLKPATAAKRCWLIFIIFVLFYIQCVGGGFRIQAKRLMFFFFGEKDPVCFGGGLGIINLSADFSVRL